MPALNKQRIYEVVRGWRAILVPSYGERDLAGKLQRAERRIEEQEAQIERQHRELTELRARILESVHGGAPTGSVDPEKITWIFGTARTGSTWLAFMMEELEDHTVWREPYVGELFGRLYHKWAGEKHAQTKHFILGRDRESWLRSIRTFVLNEASVRFPGVGDEDYLVIKEPNGSIGAPLMMQALPESRMIFLVRDPRDVVASALDAAQKGSWLYERSLKEGGARTAMFEMQKDALVESTATTYVQNIGNVREAYESHEGPKVLVKYEDLRVNTSTTMGRIYSELGIPVDDEELARAVEKHAWENVPAENKGKGKFHRKATPGGWQEDLTGEQVETVERITAPLLEEYYPAVDGEKGGPRCR